MSAYSIPLGHAGHEIGLIGRASARYESWRRQRRLAHSLSRLPTNLLVDIGVDPRQVALNEVDIGSQWF